MTRHLPPGATPPDSDADRLSDAWNEIVAEGMPADQFDPDLIETVRAVHASASDPLPDPAFTKNLREKLMDMTLPAPGTGARPTARERDTQVRLPRPMRGSFPRRWTAIAATLALLLTTAAGGYFGAFGGNGNNDHQATMLAATQATPDAGTAEAYVDPCAGVEPYLPCGTNPWIGQGMITTQGLTAAQRSVNKVQMQGWEIDAGEQVTIMQGTDPVVGIGADIVISGAYTATFSAQVLVSRPTPGGGTYFQRFDANAQVELSRGDMVTYALGTKLSLGNALTSTMLQFKSILFSDGDVSPESLGFSGNFRSRIDGDGALPANTWDHADDGISVLVTYQNKGIPAPPEDADIGLVLGPVASTLAGGGPDEGFAVWVSWAMG